MKTLRLWKVWLETTTTNINHEWEVVNGVELPSIQEEQGENGEEDVTVYHKGLAITLRNTKKHLVPDVYHDLKIAYVDDNGGRLTLFYKEESD